MFEINLDTTVIDRQAYSVLDFLGDIGGLAEALLYISSFTLAIVNLGKFDNMMSRLLYRASSKTSKLSQVSKKEINQVSNLDTSIS